MSEVDRVLATEDEIIAILARKGVDWPWPTWSVDVSDASAVGRAVVRGMASLSVRGGDYSVAHGADLFETLGGLLAEVAQSRVAIALAADGEAGSPMIPVLLGRALGVGGAIVAALGPHSVVELRRVSSREAVDMASAVVSAHVERSVGLEKRSLLLEVGSDPTQGFRSVDGRLERFDGVVSSPAEVREVISSALTGGALSGSGG